VAGQIVGGSSLGGGGVDSYTQGFNLVAQVLQGSGVSTSQAGLEGIETGAVDGDVITDGSDGGVVGGHGVSQGSQVGVDQGLTGIEFFTDDVEQAADDESGLVTGERFVAAEGAIGEADDDAEVSDAVH